MSMPIQKPGRSKQDYGTPHELIAAVTDRFGELTVDLAATAENTKCKKWITPEEDALSAEQDWAQLIGDGIGWLNPPFADIAPWAEKCMHESRFGTRILLLVPASIGAEWFANYVEDSARVIGLRPRLTFEGCKDPYPKDCCLCVYGDWACIVPVFSTWRWRA